jgi:hypothetical protein
VAGQSQTIVERFFHLSLGGAAEVLAGFLESSFAVLQTISGGVMTSTKCEPRHVHFEFNLEGRCSIQLNYERIKVKYSNENLEREFHHQVHQPRPYFACDYLQAVFALSSIVRIRDQKKGKARFSLWEALRSSDYWGWNRE